jgi:hypothetical protein
MRIRVLLSERRGVLKHVAILLLLASSVSVPTYGQRAGTASVSGDVFLLMQSGDTKRGSGLTVYLLRPDDTMQKALQYNCSRAYRALDVITQDKEALDSQLAAASKYGATDDRLLELKSKMDALTARVSALPATFVSNMAIDVNLAKVDSTSTGIAAHYRFKNVKPRQYIMHAAWTIGDRDYEWWIPLSIKAGETRTIDLDTQSARQPPGSRCH